MVTIEVEFNLSDENLVKNLKDAINQFFIDVLDRIIEVALENLGTPRADGFITWNTGPLGKSARKEWNSEAMKGFIIFSAPYAAFVEYGTDPHIAPLGPSLAHKKLQRGKNKGKLRITKSPDQTKNPLDWWAWTRQKRIAIYSWYKGKYYGVHTLLGFSVWKKIQEQGSDPHPYLRPAIIKVQNEMPAIAKQHGLVYQR